MRRNLILLLAASACSAAEADPLHHYVVDLAVGRRALEASLVRTDNGYARSRLAHYRENDWGELPEYDPETTPLRRADGPQDSATWARSSGGDLRSVGARAFFEYPVQIANDLPAVLAEPEHGGVWIDGDRFGAVWARTPAGIRAAYTCATCHASPSAHGLVAGRNNADLDVARISAPRSGWPLGTLDVTDDELDNPVSITDLRSERWQKTMHHAATLRMAPVALAVRIEGLIIESNGGAVRPPRRIAAGLAAYVLSLGSSAPRPPFALFDRACATCHAGDGASGEGVALETVGTDPAVGLSAERGTGRYRVPSLRGVGNRRRLFASGAAENVEAVLDPNRRISGHPFGLDLSDAERAELLAYLHTL